MLVQVSEQQMNGIGAITMAEEGQCPASTQRLKVDGLPLLSEKCVAGSFSTEMNAERCEEFPQDRMHEGGDSE